MDAIYRELNRIEGLKGTLLDDIAQNMIDRGIVEPNHNATEADRIAYWSAVIADAKFVLGE